MAIWTKAGQTLPVMELCRAPRGTKDLEEPLNTSLKAGYIQFLFIELKIKYDTERPTMSKVGPYNA